LKQTRQTEAAENIQLA